MVDKEYGITQEYLETVGIDIPETLQRARLTGTIPRSRLTTLAVLLEAMAHDVEIPVEGRLAYGNAARWLKETIEKTEDPSHSEEFERRLLEAGYEKHQRGTTSFFTGSPAQIGAKMSRGTVDPFYANVKLGYTCTLAWKCWRKTWRRKDSNETPGR
jgi:hypothetical protein